MKDDEYPAYLKNQSYDDLISISHSINKETQANRYTMVLAEITEREKRGEKPENKWQPPIALLLGVFFIFEFVLDLILPRIGWKPIIHIMLGVICFIIAWFSRKK